MDFKELMREARNEAKEAASKAKSKEEVETMMVRLVCVVTVRVGGRRAAPGSRVHGGCVRAEPVPVPGHSSANLIHSAYITSSLCKYVYSTCMRYVFLRHRQPCSRLE